MQLSQWRVAYNQRGVTWTITFHDATLAFELRGCYVLGEYTLAHIGRPPVTYRLKMPRTTMRDVVVQDTSWHVVVKTAFADFYSVSDREACMDALFAGEESATVEFEICV